MATASQTPTPRVDFDISPDGRQLILEHVQEKSNIVLVDLP